VLLKVTGDLTYKALPPPAPLPAVALEPPVPPLPPIPTIVPLLVTITPPGNDPVMVIALLLVLLALIITPLLILTINLDVPFHPAAIAPALIQKLVWLAETV
jgi:hypothetical protein